MRESPAGLGQVRTIQPTGTSPQGRLRVLMTRKWEGMLNIR